MGTTRRQPNRLFLNNTQGALIDATTSEIADVGPSFGATAGDINNDGEIDIFQAVISQEVTPEGDFDLGKNRSLMLLNIGEGEFLDVTEGVGLGHLYGVQTVGPALQDVDNDGDLDLILTEPFALYFNDGTGYFTENTPLSGIEEGTTTATFGDVNLDGFLDMWLGGGSNTSVGVPGKLYLNNGNDNHWLRVELVGTESNRSAIGARIIASSSGFQQTREIYGGLGFQQDEMVAHFGLRERTQVDELEIRWPSGQTDILTDISADQKIRVIEGRGEYYLVQPSIWEVPPPESVEYGKQIDFVAVAKPALFEPGAEIVRVTGDLSSLGGPEAVPLEDLGDGTYKLEASFVVGRTSDLRDISVFIEQETSLGPHWINLSRNIVVEGDPNTAVTETFAASLPQSITLAQNYPNPFNGSTVIRFALPTVSEVELAIFNLTGQQVATLASGERRAGTYTLRWDGRDDDGRALASGVYLYRLRTGDGQQVETRKLLLIK